MDQDESSPDDRGRELLTAARRLLDANHIADEREVILTSVVQVLASGPASGSNVHRAVNELWPAADLSLERISRALADAEQAGFVVPVSGADAEGIDRASDL